MEFGSIKITNNNVHVQPIDGEVWLSINEISDLFDVFQHEVNKAIGKVMKDNPQKYLCEKHYTKPNKSTVFLYNLEIILELAFIIKSTNSQVFKNWIIKRLTSSLTVINIPINLETNNTIAN